MNRAALNALFGGELRYKILRCLASRTEPCSLADIAQDAGVPIANLMRIVNHWADEGLLRKIGQARRWLYQLTDDPDIFRPLRPLLDPIAHLAGQLRERMQYDPDIVAAAIFGSIATGESRPDSDVDLLVLGNASELYLNADLASLGKEIGRPIHASVFTPSAFAQLIENGDSFASSLLAGKLIPLKGQLHGRPTPSSNAG